MSKIENLLFKWKLARVSHSCYFDYIGFWILYSTVEKQIL